MRNCYARAKLSVVTGDFGDFVRPQLRRAQSRVLQSGSYVRLKFFAIALSNVSKNAPGNARVRICIIEHG